MSRTTISVPESIRKFLKKEAARQDSTQVDLLKKALSETYGYGEDEDEY